MYSASQISKPNTKTTEPRNVAGWALWAHLTRVEDIREAVRGAAREALGQRPTLRQRTDEEKATLDLLEEAAWQEVLGFFENE